MFSFLDDGNEETTENVKPQWLRSLVSKSNRRKYTLNPIMKDHLKMANQDLIHRLERNRKREDYKSKLLSNMIIRGQENKKQKETRDMCVQTLTQIKTENIFFFLLGGVGMFFFQKYKSNF
jgi:hypothetical protein